MVERRKPSRSDVKKKDGQRLRDAQSKGSRSTGRENATITTKKKGSGKLADKLRSAPLTAHAKSATQATGRLSDGARRASGVTDQRVPTLSKDRKGTKK